MSKIRPNYVILRCQELTFAQFQPRNEHFNHYISASQFARELNKRHPHGHFKHGFVRLYLQLTVGQ